VQQKHTELTAKTALAHRSNTSSTIQLLSPGGHSHLQLLEADAIWHAKTSSISKV